MASKTNSQLLLDNSIAAALSAIEIYNKPDFKYRNEIFVILMSNAWELLLKAKILADNTDNLHSIYVILDKTTGTFKTNRNGTPLTIELLGALKALSVDDVIQDNITSLIEIRDTATHFVNRQPIDYLVYSLGVACLKNYHKLVNDWFKRNLLEYSFYILPIGFVQHFHSFSLLDFDKEPDNIQRMLKNIDANQGKESTNGFHFNCEIEINLVSAKKITSNTDLTVGLDPTSKHIMTVEKKVRITEQYPLSYKELYDKANQKLPPKMVSTYLNKFLSVHKIKNNKDYSEYNFRTLLQETEYNKTGNVSKNTPSIYNHNCLNYVIAELPKFVAGLQKTP
jgi:hypothetical protein